MQCTGEDRGVQEAGAAGSDAQGSVGGAYGRCAKLFERAAAARLPAGEPQVDDGQLPRPEELHPRRRNGAPTNLHDFHPCLVFMHMSIERALYTSCSEDAVEWGAFGVWIKCIFSQANIVLLPRMYMPSAR